MGGVRAHLARNWWVWISALPFGLGAWAPAVPGQRCGVRRWVVLGIFWPALSLSAEIWASASSGTHKPPLAGLLVVSGWLGGFVTSLVILPEYQDRLARGLIIERRWPEPTAQARRWSARYATLAFIVTFAGAYLLGLVLRYAFAVHISVGVAVLIVDAMLLLALVPLARRRGLSAADLGLRQTLALPSLGLALLMLLAYAAFAALYGLVFMSASERHSAGLLSQVKHLGTLATIVAVIAIAVSAPVVEEIFFRGLVYRSLRNRLPTFWAALIAGSMFGLVHVVGYPLVTVPVKGIFGVLACLLYERTGSILPGIAVHSFVDATAIDIALTGNDNVVLIVFGGLMAALVIRWSVLSIARAPGRTAIEGSSGGGNLETM